MWEHDKRKSLLIVAGVVGVGAIALTIRNNMIWMSEVAHPPVISDQIQIREAVDGSWAKRVALNQALSADNAAENQSNAPSIKLSPSSQAGQNLRAIAYQIHSAELKKVLGLDGDGSYKTRREAISALGNRLRADDLRWLYGFLGSTVNIDGLSKQGQDALKDTIMVYLTSDRVILPQTVEILRQIYLDPSQDPTIRNYAVQYLANAVMMLPDGSQKMAVQELLVNAASSVTSSDVAGSALLGLNRQSEFDQNEAEQQQVSQLALNMANNQSLTYLQRASPLQICGQRGVQDAAPIARDLAVNTKQVIPKMAALATLSQIGDAGDVQLLQLATKDPDERVRKAANAALSRLKARLHI